MEQGEQPGRRYGARPVAVACNTLTLAALVLLTIDLHNNLPVPLAVLLPAAAVLYGTAFFLWWRKRR